MTKKSEKTAAKKMTKTEQAAVKEQLGTLISDSIQAPAAERPPRRRPIRRGWRRRRPHRPRRERPWRAKPKKKRKPKAPTTPSTVENPVEVVHQLCEAMTNASPVVAPKEFMAALLAKGITRHTASTKLHKRRKAQQAAK